MTRPLVYVAGPYTKPDPVSNTRRAIDIGTKLWASGLLVPIIPHLTMFWDLLRPMSHEAWLEYDLEVLARCDALLRLPGESSGADGEVRRAYQLSIPVFVAGAVGVVSEDLLQWARDRVEAL